MTDRCNEHGVYEADETLTLERDRKGWRGLPVAEIEVRNLGTHWIWSASFQLLDGSCRGHAQPLVDHARYRAADRSAALYAAQASLILDLSEIAKQPGDARRIMLWIDGLNPVQADLFGAAA